MNTDTLGLSARSEILRLRGLLMSVLQIWEAGLMFDSGTSALFDGVIYRAVRANLNVIPISPLGGEYWMKIGPLNEKP